MRVDVLFVPIKRDLAARLAPDKKLLRWEANGGQHCLDRWILRNLGNKLLSELRNGALRQFVEILSAAGLAPKTIVNVVTVVKFVVASAVDEEGDQIHPAFGTTNSVNFPWSSRKSRIVPRSMNQKYTHY